MVMKLDPHTIALTCESNSICIYTMDGNLIFCENVLLTEYNTETLCRSVDLSGAIQLLFLFVGRVVC